MRLSRLTVGLVTVLALVVGCGGPPPTQLAVIPAVELEERMSDALDGQDAYRVRSDVRLVIEGEPDQVGTQVAEWTQDGFRYVSEATDGAGGYSEFMCVDGVAVSRSEKGGSWREQPRTGPEHCSGEARGGMHLGRAIDASVLDDDGVMVHQLTVRQVQDHPVTPEPGQGAVTRTSITTTLLLDPATYLPIRSATHQEMPFTRWESGFDGALVENRVDQYMDQTSVYEYDPSISLRLPEGF